MTQNPYYGQQQPVGPPPDNNLVWAILVTVFCCLPLGIVSIVKSSQVNTLWPKVSSTLRENQLTMPRSSPCGQSAQVLPSLFCTSFLSSS